MQMPEIWPFFASALSLAMSSTVNSNALPLLAMTAREFSERETPFDDEGYQFTGQGPLGRLAISCGDAVPYEADEKTWPSATDIVDRMIETLGISSKFGARWIAWWLFIVNIQAKQGLCS